MNKKVFLNWINGDYLRLIEEGLKWIGFGQLVSAQSRVFIKPNLTFPTYQPGVMTTPQAIEAAIIAIRKYTPNIYIGDSDSGGYNRFSMNEVYQETGILSFADRYGVKVVNLSLEERKPIQFEYRNKKFVLALPRLLTDTIDLTVTMPVPKIHCNTGVSLTFKNQWGCIPENKDRLRLHPYFQHVILEVCKAVKAKVAIMDGTYGLNNNGPMRGTPIKLDWIMISDDLGAGARIACGLMQHPLERVAHLRYANKLGCIPPRHQIALNQDFAPFIKESFYLHRRLSDFPGYLAFKYPLFAYLAYFSPLSAFFHKILYLFREPFYDYKKYAAGSQDHSKTDIHE